jgi:CSLREA domain-containing protein
MKPRSKWWLLLLLVSLLLLFSACTPTPNCVVNYTVTKEEDTNDGVCSSLDCSLREAVLNANAFPGPHTITLPAGGYTLTIPGINEDAGETGDLDITKDLTIIGIGAPSISGNIDRSFHYPPQFSAPEIYQKSSV